MNSFCSMVPPFISDTKTLPLAIESNFCRLFVDNRRAISSISKNGGRLINNEEIKRFVA